MTLHFSNPLSRVSRSFALLTGLVSVIVMAQTPEIRNSAGVAVRVDASDREPVLLVTVPDGPPSERTFKILLPEHITVRPHGQADAVHPYIYSSGAQPLEAVWKASGNALHYDATLGDLHLFVRATLEDDGIVFHYEFTNRGTVDYDMVTAVTDPRFRVVFYDPRLERTYVHDAKGFSLLAQKMPQRLTMPLKEWFPVRYLASYTAPIPTELVRKDAAGITYRYSADRVDTSMIATVSKDGQWVAASFSRDPGNVWSNPELTCQHVDPQVPLRAGGHAAYEMKILIFKGNLDDALQKVAAQIGGLK